MFSNAQMLDKVRLDDAKQAEVAALINEIYFSGDDSDVVNGSEPIVVNTEFPRTPEEGIAYRDMMLEAGTSRKIITLRGVRKWTRPKDLRKRFVSTLLATVCI
jgi:hypothetical protein